MSQLSIDLSGQGSVLEAASGRIDGTADNDLLIGGIGDNDLRGGLGNDTLVDGHGSDDLRGGAGADTFVFGRDGEDDEIRDFDPDSDRLDFSAVPMLYHESGIRVIEQKWGARVFLPDDERINIRSADGGPLTEAQIYASIDWETDRPPLVLFNEVNGDDGDNLITGTGSTDVFLGNGGNDTLNGLGGSDRLDGGEGNDTLLGGDGSDHLQGNSGADRLEGQGGDDTLDGGWGETAMTH